MSFPCPARRDSTRKYVALTLLSPGLSSPGSIKILHRLCPTTNPRMEERLPPGTPRKKPPARMAETQASPIVRQALLVWEIPIFGGRVEASLALLLYLYHAWVAGDLSSWRWGVLSITTGGSRGWVHMRTPSTYYHQILLTASFGQSLYKVSGRLGFFVSR